MDFPYSHYWAADLPHLFIYLFIYFVYTDLYRGGKAERETDRREKGENTAPPSIEFSLVLSTPLCSHLVLGLNLESHVLLPFPSLGNWYISVCVYGGGFAGGEDKEMVFHCCGIFSFPLSVSFIFFSLKKSAWSCEALRVIHFFCYLAYRNVPFSVIGINIAF